LRVRNNHTLSPRVHRGVKQRIFGGARVFLKEQI